MLFINLLIGRPDREIRTAFLLLKVLKNIKIHHIGVFCFEYTPKWCIFAYRLQRNSATLSKCKVNGKNNTKQ